MGGTEAGDENKQTKAKRSKIRVRSRDWMALPFFFLAAAGRRRPAEGVLGVLGVDACYVTFCLEMAKAMKS
jgi:hypothetical protein